MHSLHEVDTFNILGAFSVLQLPTVVEAALEYEHRWCRGFRANVVGATSSQGFSSHSCTRLLFLIHLLCILQSWTRIWFLNGSGRVETGHKICRLGRFGTGSLHCQEFFYVFSRKGVIISM